MNFPTRKVSWVNWQFGLLKIAMISFGILLGVYFRDFWRPILTLVWIAGAVSMIWVSVIWLLAMRS